MTTAKSAPKSRQPRPADYTHSPWSGKKYDRPPTQAELIAESMAILRRHPTISRVMVGRK